MSCYNILKCHKNKKNNVISEVGKEKNDENLSFVIIEKGRGIFHNFVKVFFF